MRRLEALVDSGQLRFVYVLGLARSSSTIICRLLGEALDGAVFEPATPAAFNRRTHYARTILRAYDRARAAIGSDRPVSLAIKDLTLFLDDPQFEAIVARAAHVVFTIREPAAQQASLARQLKHEFSPLQRIDAVVRHPFEALWMACYFLAYGRRFVREASDLLGYRFTRLPRLAMAGWNLASYRNLERQLAAREASSISVLDADALRRDPQRAQALLTAIAARIAPAGTRTSIEIAGHSRMLPRSKWAAEALASHAITAAAPAPRNLPAPDAFETTLLGVTGAAYARIVGPKQGQMAEAAE